MSYNTRFTGEIAIEPPLSNAELASCRFVADGFDYEPAIKVRVEEEPVETDDGTLIRRTGVAIESASEDAFKGYDFLDEMKEVVAAYGRTRDGQPRQFTGHISGDGEDSDDMWVCKVLDGRVVKVKAAIVWPADLDKVTAGVDACRALLARRTGNGPEAVTADELQEAAASLCRAVAAFADRFETEE